MEVNDFKDLLFAFVSHNYDVYNLDDRTAMIAQEVCSSCGTNWQKSIRECFYCGSLIPFVKICLNCKTQSSMTTSTKKCANCNSNQLAQSCINDDCPLYKDEELKKLIPMSKLAADEKSSSSAHTISHSTCLECKAGTSIFKTIIITIDPATARQADAYLEIKNIDEIIVNGESIKVSSTSKIMNAILSLFK